MTSERDGGAVYVALQAQEDFSAMQRDLRSTEDYPNPDDPRYTPVIGEWDGYAAPEMRYAEFATKRRELRRQVLAARDRGEA